MAGSSLTLSSKSFSCPVILLMDNNMPAQLQKCENYLPASVLSIKSKFFFFTSLVAFQEDLSHVPCAMGGLYNSDIFAITPNSNIYII